MMGQLLDLYPSKELPKNRLKVYPSKQFGTLDEYRITLYKTILFALEHKTWCKKFTIKHTYDITIEFLFYWCILATQEAVCFCIQTLRMEDIPHINLMIVYGQPATTMIMAVYEKLLQ